MSDPSNLLMLSGVAATCADCGDERVFVPVDNAGAGEFCCTSCDAAVFLLAVVGPDRSRSTTRVA
jgi:hypothetical protein